MQCGYGTDLVRSEHGLVFEPQYTSGGKAGDITMEAVENCLVIRNGTLIDGSGAPPKKSDSIIIQGNRIQTIGAVPPTVDLDKSTVIDATEQWIMPGLIDSHCHLSFGHPMVHTVESGKGAISPEFSALRAARNAQNILLAGVTSISVPGGTWFIDAGVRDAVKAGLIEGPRIYCAGQYLATYGSMTDYEPSWVGIPAHAQGVLVNSVVEMVAETRRQLKHGVNFIKISESYWGDQQMIAPEEMKAVVDEAHRRNAQVTIHSRGAGSTRSAAEAGMDWIIHADFAKDADLQIVADRHIPIIPTAFFILHAASDESRPPAARERLKRNWDGIVNMLQTSRRLGITLLCGTDTGNSPVMPYGEYHSREAEILVEYGGYTPMEAISAMTRDNAVTVGLDKEVGEIAPGKLADIIILRANPVADLRVLRRGTNLSTIIKDGKILMSNGIPTFCTGDESQKNRLTFKDIRPSMH
jgi:imidazolonepropionase-like amidohydrolase